MRILHTSDWHLGKTLGDYDRTTDFRAFLTQLLTLVKREAPDVLIVAGDVFDVSMPPTSAQTLYYDFLAELAATNLSGVVVTPGNHDSASFLSAPAGLLKSLRIFVAGRDIESQCTIVRDRAGKPLCAVAAVPFLKEGELRRGGFDLTDAERYGAYESAVGDYYAKASAALTELQEKEGAHGIPRIATAHLFIADVAPPSERAAWAARPEVGTLRLVGLDRLGTDWDYLALGHLHKPHVFETTPRARYCGSPLDLSFPKGEVKRHVVLVDFDEKTGAYRSDTEIEIEKPSTLAILRESLSEMPAKLNALAQTAPNAFVSMELTEARVARADAEGLIDLAQTLGLRPVAVRLTRSAPIRTEDAAATLALLTPESVFEQVLDEAGYGDETKRDERETLKTLFMSVLTETRNEEAQS